MRERRKFEIVDHREEKYSTGGKSSYRVPPNVGQFKTKRTGPIRIDILPFQVTAEHNKFDREICFSSPGGWYKERTYYAHRDVGPDHNAYTCNWKTFGKPCPICDVRTVLAQSGSEADRDRAWNLKPSQRQLWLVQEINDRTGEYEGGICLWEEAYFNFGKQLDQYIANASIENRPRYKRHFDPDDGYVLRLAATAESTGSGGGKYTKFSVHEFIARRDPLPDDLVDHGIDLDALVQESDYDTLKRIFTGRDEEEETDSGPPARVTVSVPAERPRPPADPAPAPRPRPAPAPESPLPAPAPRPRAAAPPPPVREPEPAPAEEIPASGDLVEFEYRGDTVAGRVVSTNDATHIAKVEMEGGKVITLGWDEIRVTRAAFDTTEPAPEPPPPPPPAPAPRAAVPRPRGSAAAPPSDGKWDDETDSRMRKPAAPPPAGGDDEAPPVRKRR